MRNLLQYPLEPSEVISALDTALSDQAAKRQIGGMTGHALYAIRKLLVARPSILEEICELDKQVFKA